MEFIDLDIKSVCEGSTTHFDLFIKPEAHSSFEEWVLYAKAPYYWTDEETIRLEEFGFNCFYIKSKDKENLFLYKKSIALLHDGHWKNTLKTCKKDNLNNLLEIAYYLIAATFMVDISNATLNALQDISSAIIAQLNEDTHFFSILNTSEHHDSYIFKKSLKMALLLTCMALKNGEKDSNKLQNYFLAGIFHDIGKRKISNSILSKPGPLNKEEWKCIFQHTKWGLEILKSFDLPKLVYNVVELHHEKIDGSGYPYQLYGESIPEYVQWASAADVFNALTTDRCYYKKMTLYEALTFMKHKMNTPFSPNVFRLLVENLHG